MPTERLVGELMGKGLETGCAELENMAFVCASASRDIRGVLGADGGGMRDVGVGVRRSIGFAILRSGGIPSIHGVDYRGEQSLRRADGDDFVETVLFLFSS